MAVKYDEVELLRGGIKYDRPSKGNFALNMLRRYGAWEVRQGFGQLTQFDTLMTHNIKTTTAEWGYRLHLGSYLMTTDFGHEQILSVFKARVYTSEVENERAQIANVYLVSIYDTTTRERWEEPLYRHTSEGGMSKADNELRHGQYETNFNKDYQAWVVATSEEVFGFAEVRDTVYFGSAGTDLYAYSPCTFRGNRRQFVSGAHHHSWAPPYSESSMIWRVRPSPGSDTEAYGETGYRTSSEVPSPQALTTWGGRLVIAGNDREVFFSQKDRPTSFIDLDFIIVPTERTITAMVAAGQAIYIFTDTETWLYQPATLGPDPLASQGMESVLVSDTIGCISQACVTKTNNALIWLSNRGVHISSGAMDIETISTPIGPLFTDFITDPVTSFFSALTAETGTVDTRLPQRNSVITLQTRYASVVYSELLQALLVTLPEERVSLCYSEGEWSMWTYESNTADVKVGAVQNILMPWLVSKGDSLYLVGAGEAKTVADSARYGGVVNVDDSTTSRSAYILEYGRGGAIDRSVDDEDYRTIAGKYRSYPDATSALDRQGILILGEWLPVEQQYKFTGTATGATAPNGESAPVAPGRTVLVPVYLVPGSAWTGGGVAADSVNRIRIRYFFDFTKWRPIFNDATTSTDIDLIFPSERVASSSGWTARCEDGAGAANRGGLEVNLDWQGTGVGHTFDPYMNLVAEKLNLLCYIPMMSIDTSDVSGMGIMRPNTAPAGYINTWCEMTSGTAAVHNCDVLAWREWRFASVNKEDNVAQPVDWAYMSEDVGLPEDARVKGRGASIRMLTHGTGTDVTGGWTQGLLNTMLAADLKTWTAQVIDFIGGVASFRKPVSIKTNLYPTSLVHETVRDRVETGAGSIRTPSFGSSIKYANESLKTFEANTYLIGDEQVDEIVTSDSVKGNSVSMMLFGFMRNPAERLKLESVKLLFRVVGAGRRRRGR